MAYIIILGVGNMCNVQRVLFFLFTYVSVALVQECNKQEGAILRDGNEFEKYDIAVLKTRTVHQCMHVCFSWSPCKSVNFKKNNGQCELNCKAYNETYDTIQQKSNFIYADTSNYPSVAAGQCAQHACEYNFLCFPNPAGSYKCVPVPFDTTEVAKYNSRYYDFESGMCGWRQDYLDHGDWRLRSSATVSEGTGPSGDHTSGYGQYIYMEASVLATNDTVRLISDPLQINASLVINFWYHMWSNKSDPSIMGTLNVLVSTDSWEMLMFSRSGNQGESWLSESVTSYSLSGIFTVVFEAVRGTGRSSDIALDDIQIILD